jgi:hypothetical protein
MNSQGSFIATSHSLLRRADTFSSVVTVFHLAWYHRVHSMPPLYRYSPNSPYESNDANAWRGYLHPTPGHTGPWTYSPDRQVHSRVAVFYSDCVFGAYRVVTGAVCDSGNRFFVDTTKGTTGMLCLVHPPHCACAMCTHFRTSPSASISLAAPYYVTGGERELAERDAGAVRVRQQRPVRRTRRVRLCRGLDRVSSASAHVWLCISGVLYCTGVCSCVRLCVTVLRVWIELVRLCTVFEEGCMCIR